MYKILIWVCTQLHPQNMTKKQLDCLDMNLGFTIYVTTENFIGLSGLITV